MTSPHRRTARTFAAWISAGATLLLALTAPAAAGDSTSSVVLSLPTQAMEGSLKLAPGALLRAGYSFTMPGAHASATLSMANAAVTFAAECATGSGGGTITVPLAAGPYTDPAGAKAWFPSGDQKNTASYQGALTLPDLCQGGLMSLAKGGTFTAVLQSSNGTDPVNIRWHYSGAGSKGGWSGTYSVRTAAPQPPSPPAPSQIVVKVDIGNGYTINELLARFPIQVDSGGLASRGIYLVSPTAADDQDDPAKLAKLAGAIKAATGVIYAQLNSPIQLADTHFYGWSDGSPTPIGDLPDAYTTQAAATTLQLATAQSRTQGAGVVVAVLDTGADPTVPALTGRTEPGWNYVNDSADTSDLPITGTDNTAVGHGTFVSGLVALVAPQTRILPEKVLDSDGFGTIYGAAEGVLDAVQAGAKVINLSFGTPIQPTWNLLQDAIQQAHNAGAVVLAAAGNDATSTKHYPAAQAPTLSVAALDTSGAALTSFSDYGGWVALAAPGQDVVGPLPGGGYATWEGTSMAVPFVSGQAALLESAVPGIQPDQVRDAIQQSAQKLSRSSNQIHFGAIDIPGSLDRAHAP